jgi:hypothetical protein
MGGLMGTARLAPNAKNAGLLREAQKTGIPDTFMATTTLTNFTKMKANAAVEPLA